MSIRPSALFKAVLLLTVLLLTACEKPAPQPDQAALDAASGAYKPCAACHGAQGEGNAALNAPSLVNLDADYLARQLENFASGKRGTDARDSFGQMMAAQSASYSSKEQIAAISEQIATFSDISPTITLNGNPDNGRDNYNMVCGACHGPEAVGNPALNAPSLRGIDDWYLVRQYENFRAGIRGTHPEDRFGRQMAHMGQILESEAVVKDVATYLAALGPND